jgi:hypothetical protein
LVERQHGAAAHQERVAVGRRFGDAARAGHPAGAGDVFDDDLLTKHFT